MKTTELICICCPRGCNLKATLDQGKLIQCEGNACPRGASYAAQEILHPMRTLTSSVKISGSKLQRQVSVKSNQEIPKELLSQAMLELSKLKLQTPVTKGQVVIKNLLDTGADVIITKSLN